MKNKNKIVQIILGIVGIAITYHQYKADNVMAYNIVGIATVVLIFKFWRNNYHYKSTDTDLTDKENKPDLNNREKTPIP